MRIKSRLTNRQRMIYVNPRWIKTKRILNIFKMRNVELKKCDFIKFRIQMLVSKKEFIYLKMVLNMMESG
jgi:hypothetical protein